MGVLSAEVMLIGGTAIAALSTVLWWFVRQDRRAISTQLSHLVEQLAKIEAGSRQRDADATAQIGRVERDIHSLRENLPHTYLPRAELTAMRSELREDIRAATAATNALRTELVTWIQRVEDRLNHAPRLRQGGTEAP